MTASPIIVGLKRRFEAHRNSPNGHKYQAFTTAFDEVLDPANLAALHSKLSPEQKHSFDDAAQRFDELFMAERVEIAANGAALVRDLQHRLATEERSRTVVSFLIDHSGSMRGLRMMSALLAVEGAVDALDHANVATEILGFTTASWKGGKSRRAWRWAGKPANPGRLCDLRHLIYGTADRSTRHPWHLRMALRSDTLHENIDGEALIWAAGRLDTTRWTRRVICLISDGAPIDDSTLLANEDRNLLARHLEEAEQRLTAESFTIGTLLIGRENVREPALFERAEEPQEAGVALMRMIRRAFLER
jgi:cobaltochelatase CobT